VSRTQIALGVAAVVVAVLGALGLTVGQWFVGPDWHVYGDESRATTSAQEQAAMRCAPFRSSVVVLESDPAEIDIHLHGSAGRANGVARCLKHSAGIVDAGPVRSR
jgi:hypothetical protein